MKLEVAFAKSVSFISGTAHARLEIPTAIPFFSISLNSVLGSVAMSCNDSPNRKYYTVSLVSDRHL